MTKNDNMHYGDYTLTFDGKTVTLENTDITMTLPKQDNFSIDTASTQVSLGKEDIEDILALLKVIKNLDENHPIRKSFNRERVKNKLKG